MPRAYLLIRPEPVYRRHAFEAGLRELGFQIAGHPREPPTPADVLVIWNRYGANHALALRFEAAGARVIVAENGALGRDWLGDHWYSLTLTNPLCAGTWPAGSGDRWESFGQEICVWRNTGLGVIVLAQRGIGPPGVAQPAGWHKRAATELGAERIREHPGERPAKPLSVDLAGAVGVATWGSGAALKALLWGIPVIYGLPTWIGAEVALSISAYRGEFHRPDRSAFFHRLAWATWRVSEICRGDPFRRLLSMS